MKIKSLLLGSFATLVAVSGARAADAVVMAEPEPMEYVRICDVYGTGFYYIPGTETCLKVGGYVRVDLRGGDRITGNSRISNAGNETYRNQVRFRLSMDARSETELGTLRSLALININYEANGDGPGYDNEDNEVIDTAVIELAGFKIGVTDSLFTTFTDYSSGVLSDGLVGYGPFQTIQANYTYTGANGLSAAIGIEQGDEDEGGITEDYVPYVVGGVSLTQGWGKVGIVAGYDTWQQEVAVKARLDINVTDTASVFIMGAYDTADTDGGGQANFYAPWGGQFAVWGGAAVKFNDKATFNAEVGYDDFENFSIAANVEYELVPGFKITPEINYVDNFDRDNADGIGGRIRFQRSF